MLKLGELFSEMIFQRGFVHCDPHPGNILVHCAQTNTDAHSNGKLEIVMLDHGLYSVSATQEEIQSLDVCQQRAGCVHPLPSLPPQELSDDFRVSYCKLWQALIHEDHDAIRQHCVELQAGSLYRLLACMVTARAWANIEAGITNSTRTKAEVSIVYTV